MLWHRQGQCRPAEALRGLRLLLVLLVVPSRLSMGRPLEHANNITESETWHANVGHRLTAQVHVLNGATLTIMPGVTVVAKYIEGFGYRDCPRSYDSMPGAPALIIHKGSRIIAHGTKAHPITFQSEGDFFGDEHGTWGGIVIIGNAPVNTYTGGPVSGLAAEVSYGGDDPQDDSGILSYVRIEHGGVKFIKDIKMGSLLLAGVGNGTRIDHVEVGYSLDDGIEIVGGTVNMRYISLVSNCDDSLDIDWGYQGTIQFLFIYIDPIHGGNRAYEIDSHQYPPILPPRTRPVISHSTLIGQGLSDCLDAQQGELMKLRDYSAGVYLNHVAANTDVVIDVDRSVIVEVVDGPPKNISMDNIYITKNFYVFEVKYEGDAFGPFLPPTDLEALGSGLCSMDPCDKEHFLDPRLPGPVGTWADAYDDVRGYNNPFLLPAEYPGAFEPGQPLWLDGLSVLIEERRVGAAACEAAHSHDHDHHDHHHHHNTGVVLGILAASIFSTIFLAILVRWAYRRLCGAPEDGHYLSGKCVQIGKSQRMASKADS